MPLIRKSINLKILLIYIVYNLFLKAFFSLFNRIIYAEYPGTVIQKSFFVSKDDSNVIELFVPNVILLIYFDIFMLFPYTIMNIYIFAIFINYLTKEYRDVIQNVSFVILKVYLFWCLAYLCSIGFGYFLEDNHVGSFFGEHASPYGIYTITYLLLGNFVFLLIFVPFWNKFLKKWVLAVEKENKEVE